MKSPLIFSFKGGALAVGLLLSATTHGAINVSFDGVSVINSPNGYIGGWFGNEVAFETWVGSTREVNVVDEADNRFLRVFSDSPFRSAGFAVDPQSLGAAGTYRLTFDVLNFEGGLEDKGIVSIWAGSGYVIGSTGNALIVDTLINELRPQGDATAAQLGSDFTITGALTNQTIDFNYDGTSAIVFFFGAENLASDPPVFPTIDYDNIRITTSPIPEPSTGALLLGVVALSLAQFKRRKRS